ncbi:MAG: tRNA adenosine(34) deaminase TadA [Clostridia bacterium]|nr:tRNA adenosine(34) deaminase TadA [Clostridia bacterium]
MKIAIELAKEAAENDEVPVGAIVVKNGEIIAKAFNQKETQNCATRHAEIIALENASKAVGNWWLEDCELFVTLEPCTMCAGAMVLSRIEKLYFGAYDEKTGAVGSVTNVLEQKSNHKIEYEGGVLQDECSKLLSDFFKAKRKN